MYCAKLNFGSCMLCALNIPNVFQKDLGGLWLSWSVDYFVNACEFVFGYVG